MPTIQLQWSYCECGCKCHTARGTNFHIFWDLKDTYTLFESFLGSRSNAQEFATYKEAKMAAERRFKARFEGPLSS